MSVPECGLGDSKNSSDKVNFPLGKMCTPVVRAVAVMEPLQSSQARLAWVTEGGTRDHAAYLAGLGFHSSGDQKSKTKFIAW
jgi:hypothetical protein